MKDINAMYKKMALELHPDKGGDPEKFQELQEMKERLYMECSRMRKCRVSDLWSGIRSASLT